jgi:hypothetical protein
MTEAAHHILEAWRDDLLDATQAAQLANLPREEILADLRLTAALHGALAGDDEIAFRRSLLARIGAEHDGAHFRRTLHRRLPRRRTARAPKPSGWALAMAASLLAVVALALWYQTHSHRVASRESAAPVITHQTDPHAVGTSIAQLRSGQVHLADGSVIAAPASLPAGTALVCDDDVTAALALGALLTFAPGSHCTVAPDNNLHVVALISGHVEAQVEHQSAGSALHIRTKQADVRVVGTVFQVTAHANATDIVVQKGRVAVTDRHDQQEHVLDPGQSLTIHAIPEEAAGEPMWRSLATTDLAAWNPLRGNWRSSNGELIGQRDGEGRARIASVDSFGSLRLRLQVQSDDAAQVELQVADYHVFAALSGDHVRKWCHIEATFRDGVLTATANGSALLSEPGIPNTGHGPISLYALDGSLRIRDVSIQSLETVP